MSEGESPARPRLCRQCGAVVPEGAISCPRCGQRWYMDKVEQQGTDLWQKIMEKRAAAGLGETSAKTESKELRCPHCMAVLKSPAAICPYCGKYTAQAKIIPQVDELRDEFETKPDQLNLPSSAKGLETIKGAEQRVQSYQRKGLKKAFKMLVIIAIAAIILVIGYLIARQTGVLPPSLNFSKQASPQQEIVQEATAIEISDITVTDINSTGATITWSTSTGTYGWVLYGKNESYGMIAASYGEQTSHKAVITGLEPGVSYHYAIIANDQNGKEVARSPDRLFSTPAVATVETVKAPVIKEYKVTPTDTGAFIRWTTDEPSTSQVLYGLDQGCNNSTTIDPRMVTEHSVRLTELNINTLYYYRIKSVNAQGGIVLMDPPHTFTTLIAVPSGYKIGERAPDFTLPIFKSQNNISLHSYRGQKVLLTFWAVYCPECDRELSLLQSLKAKELPNVGIICIFLESKPDDIEKTIAKYGEEHGDLTVPVVVDMYKTAAHLYNIEKLPCTFFIDSDGIIRDVEYGNFNLTQVEEKLKDL